MRYNGTSGVKPLVAANASELALDMDRDGLNLTEEAKANSDPTSEDTDGDGLADGNEALTLMTDPTLNDTDGDNLADGWEVRYNNASGVNSVVAATADELTSDLDDDGLNLTEESKANTDPKTADNPMTTTDANVSSSETNGLLSFTLLVVVSIFIPLGVALVVYRVRKRML